MRYVIGILIVTLMVWFAGCLESNPQPTPLKGDEISTGGEQYSGSREVDDDNIYASAPDDSSSVIIVGAPGAADGAEDCFATSDEEPAGDSDAGNAEADVDDDGSFVLLVPEVIPPTITLTFNYPDQDDFVLTVDIPALSDEDSDETPWVASGDMGAEEPAGPPDDYDGWENSAGAGGNGLAASDLGDGTVEVRGGFLSVTPFVTVVVANLSTNDKAVSSANVSGEFILTLPGHAGDGLSVFAVNPSDNMKATVPIILTVSE